MNLLGLNGASRLPAAVLLAVIVVIIIRRRQHRQFPFFLIYACCLALMESVLTIVAPIASRHVWFNLIWSTQASYAVLGVLAMHESFRKALRPYFHGKWWFQILVPSVVLIILGLCAWKAHQQSPPQSDRLILIYVTFYLASDYMRAAVFGLFAALVIFWRARWRPYAFGIMKGFGFYTIVGMAADLLNSDFGTKINWIFIYVPSVAYIVACLIWLGAFLKLEPENSSDKTGSLTNLDEVIELLARLKKALE